MPGWIVEGHLKRRPGEMGGFTRNVAAPEGKVNITINSDEDGPLEVFINVGRAGSDVAALAEALGRLISLQLRLPSTMSQGLIDQLLLSWVPPAPEPVHEINRPATSPLEEERHSSIVTWPNLGCRPAEASSAVAKAEAELGGDASLDALVRAALKKAAR